MAPVITWIAKAIGTWLVELGVSTVIAKAIATVVAYAIVLTPLYLYNAAQARKGRDSGNVVDSGRTLTVRQAAASRNIVYGTCKVGGLLVYAGSNGATNTYLHLVVVHAAHECNAIGDVYLNDEIVPLDGSGNATGKYAGYCIVKKHLAGAGQVVDPTLTAAMAEWDSTCVGNGICYSYVQLIHNPDLFPTGMPNISVILQGRLVYDPRTTTTAFSDNAALCLRNYLLDTELGLGATAAEVNDTAVIVAANIADEAVSLFAGGTEPRYTCNGVISSSTAPGSNIKDLCAAMAGNLPWINGQFVMNAGAWVTPETDPLTDDDLRSSLQIGLGDSMRSCFNGAKGTYISSATNYQPADVPPVINRTLATAMVAGKAYMILVAGTTTWTSFGAANNNVGTVFVATAAGTGTGIADQYAGEDQGQRIWQDINFNFTNSTSMAMRLEKIALGRNRRDITMNLQCKLTQMDRKVGDIIKYTSAKYGWTNKTFEILNYSFVYDSGSGSAPMIGIDLMVREIDADVFTWSTAEEASLPAVSVPTLPDYYSLNAVTPATPTLSASNVIQDDGAVTPRVKINWTASTDASVLNGGYTDIEYKRSVDSVWLVWGSPRGNIVEDFLTDVKTSEAIDVRIRYENSLAIRSQYSATVSFTPSTTTVATPSLDPSGQGFTTSITISATCATGGATIRYTTDGSPVNESSTTFPGGGLAVTGSIILRVRAYLSGATSAEVTQNYTLSGGGATVATPSISFSPLAYTGSATSTCTITCATSGSTIQYKINGGSFGAYSSPFSVNSGDTVVAYATKGGSADSSYNGAYYHS